MTSGWKSFFLKIVDPLFQTKDSGSVIPIKIRGTPDAPSFGVEVGRVFSREQVTSESHGPSEHDPWKKPIPSCTEILAIGRLPVDLGTDVTSRLPFVHERAGLHSNRGNNLCFAEEQMLHRITEATELAVCASIERGQGGFNRGTGQNSIWD